jgi:hypothetical protein
MGVHVYLHVEVRIESTWHHYAVPFIPRGSALDEALANAHSPKPAPADLSRPTALALAIEETSWPTVLDRAAIEAIRSPGAARPDHPEARIARPGLRTQVTEARSLDSVWNAIEFRPRWRAETAP